MSLIMLLNTQQLIKMAGPILWVLALVWSGTAQNDWIEQAREKLKSPDPTIRIQGISTLTYPGSYLGVEQLISILDSDRDVGVRQAAIFAMRSLKDKRAVPKLVPLISDPDGMISTAALSALSAIGDPSAVPSMIEALGKADLGMQFHIIEALEPFDDPRAVMPLFELKSDARDEALKALGKSAVEPMSKILLQGKSPDRWYALTVLERVADERATDALTSVLGEGQSGIGRTAANILASRVGQSAFDRLAGELKNSNPIARENALWGLASIDFHGHPGEVVIDTDLSDVLIEYEFRSPYTYRWDHHKGLPKPTDERVISYLLSGLKDENDRVRFTALECLSKIERQDVQEAIADALSDPNLIEEASLILAFRHDVRALPYLTVMLKKDGVDLNIKAASALIALGPAAVDGLVSVLSDKNKVFPKREENALKPPDSKYFAFRCGNEPPRPNYDPRVHAAWALGEIGDERGRQPLTNALKDRTEWLRQAAAQALDKLDKKKAATQN